MELHEQLRQLAASHREQGREMETLLARWEETDFLGENRSLREQAARLEADAAALQGRVDLLEEENRSLKERLFDQLYSQRNLMLETARRRADGLFTAEEQAAIGELSTHSARFMERIRQIKESLSGGDAAVAELREAADSLEARAAEYRERMRAQTKAAFREQREAVQGELDEIAGASFTGYQLEKKLRQNNVELRIGGRISVIIGIFFVLLAVVFWLGYTDASDVAKGLVAYAIGLLFVGAAEWMSRRQKSHFATGICAGGLAILFASTAIAYFTLHILTVPAAILVCLAVTGLTLLQAYRYDAQLVAVFALIGGYMPMLALDDSPVMIVSAMAYFLVLNLFVLLVALRKRWQPLKFLSILANAAGIGYLLQMRNFEGMAIGIVYVAANFLLYMAIVLVNPVLNRDSLRKSDTVLLGLNTVITASYCFALLNSNGYQAWNGLVSLGFCLFYFGLARWLRAALEEDAGSRGLFYAVSLGFFILTVPLQLEPALISLGWLFEGVALSIYGILSGRKWYRRSGLGISLLCFATFFLRDFAWGLLFFRFLNLYSPELPFYYQLPFALRFAAMVVGAVAILGATLYRNRVESPYWKTGEGQFMGLFRGLTLLGVWVFALYLAACGAARLNPEWRVFIRSAAQVALTLGLGLLYRIPESLRFPSTGWIAGGLHIAGLVATMVFGGIYVPSIHRGYFVVAVAALFLVKCGATAVLFDLLRRMDNLSREKAWFWTSLYALAALLQLLTAQGGFGVRSMIVSIVLIAWALGMIVFGFIGRLSWLRRFGLGLSLVSISKLFFIDLYSLETGQRIVSYLVFGLVFIAISYVYNFFSRRLPVRVPGEIPPPAPKPAEADLEAEE
ncbi:DUF2339 domain-containing protein [Ruminococcaceae bacterium OttesenSCG-928-L11]|nr:DUF2339 domain-containing protein [Ruminococcaceae bacterium OttesenSCG-928-L11]